MEYSEAKKNVLDWINENNEEVISFLQEIIRIPSVNPWFDKSTEYCREGDVQKLIAAKMKALGAEVELFEPDVAALAKYAGRPGYYPDHEFEGRPNLAATIKGAGKGRSALLTGHIDVVPPGTGWTSDPFGAERINGNIYGRGTVDMKGGVAAMIMAVEAILRSGIKLSGDITVGTVVDEEAGGMGSLAFVDRGYRADAAIMTEPTDLKIAPLCRGILWGKIIVHGRSGHIELPQGDWRDGGAVDAIDRAFLLKSQIDQLNKDWARHKTHPLMPIPCQIYIAQFQAGEYPTAFANRAELTFNAQYLPRERDEFNLGGNVKREIEDFIARVAATDPWMRENPPEIEWLIDADCAETPADHDFVQICAASFEELDRKPEIEGIGFHTDMGWFVNVGIPTINLGPGEPRICHQNNEHLSEKELLDATRVIALTLLKWCGFETD